jgi:hypothetical protein
MRSRCRLDGHADRAVIVDGNPQALDIAALPERFPGSQPDRQILGGASHLMDSPNALQRDGSSCFGELAVALRATTWVPLWPGLNGLNPISQVLLFSAGGLGLAQGAGTQGFL